jgi:hypothetical protein
MPQLPRSKLSRSSASLSQKATTVKKAITRSAKAITVPINSRSSNTLSDISDSTDDPATVSTCDDIETEVASLHSQDEDLDSKPELDPEAELGMFSLCIFRYIVLILFAATIRKGWRSPIYSFFSPEVTINYEGGRLYHFFPCSARKCKSKMGGIRRYQDSKDKNSTANLRHHALCCFGAEAVRDRLSAHEAEARSGSIFAAFARQGQKPFTYSNRNLTDNETR